MMHLNKIWELTKVYSLLGYRISNEYKSQFFANTVTHLILLFMWLYFWDLLFANIEEIGHYTLPMLLLLVGFIQLSDGFWQLGFFTMRVCDEIIKGNLDKYLVRPMNPLMGVMLDYFAWDPILGILASLGLIVFVMVNYFSLMILKLILALLICAIGVYIFHILTIFFGLLTFWFGRTRFLVTFYRSFNQARAYPIDIMNLPLRILFTFFFPAAMFATYPVLLITKWSAQQMTVMLLVIIFTAIIWTMLIIFTWSKGIKRYESMGG